MNWVKLAMAGAAGFVGSAGAYLVLRDQTTDSDETGEVVVIEAPRSGSNGASTLGARAVEVLSRHVGERGLGKKKTPGYHRSPFIDAVNKGVYGDGVVGVAWCARAVRWAYETAARELGLPPPFAGIKSTLGNVSTWRRPPFKRHELAEPKPGAVLLLGETHAAIVDRVVDRKTVVTVEGNHGDAVAHVRRTLKPQDMLVDVEAYARDAAAATPLAGWSRSGLDLLGADWGT